MAKLWHIEVVVDLVAGLGARLNSLPPSPRSMWVMCISRPAAENKDRPGITLTRDQWSNHSPWQKLFNGTTYALHLSHLSYAQRQSRCRSRHMECSAGQRCIYGRRAQWLTADILAADEADVDTKNDGHDPIVPLCRCLEANPPLSACLCPPTLPQTTRTTSMHPKDIIML